MTEKENDLIPMDQNLPAAEEATGKKPGLVRGARDFIENTFATLKGKDMNQAVEEFTSEMTLVVEGLSEDQNALRRDVDGNSAQLTLLEEKVLRQENDRKAEVKDFEEELKQAKKRLDSLEKALKETEKKPQKMGLGQILRQATWMVGILCVSWVLVTVLKLLGR